MAGEHEMNDGTIKMSMLLDPDDFAALTAEIEHRRDRPLPVVAETEPTEATDEDVGEYFKAHAGEWHRRIDTMPHVDVDMACRRAALTAVYRRMRARERPAPSGPDPLAKPTKEEIDRAWERYLEQEDDTYKDIRYLLDSFVADRRMRSTPPPDPEPPPPAADYMTYHPDRIEFRAKVGGEHDPVVAKITAGGLLMAMQAVTEIKRGNAS